MTKNSAPKPMKTPASSPSITSESSGRRAFEDAELVDPLGNLRREKGVQSIGVGHTSALLIQKLLIIRTLTTHLPTAGSETSSTVESISSGPIVLILLKAARNDSVTRWLLLTHRGLRHRWLL